MADPITWGLLNLIKKRVKGVQTTLDGVSDKVSGLPDSLDADFTEVKSLISDTKEGIEVKLESLDQAINNIQILTSNTNSMVNDLLYDKNSAEWITDLETSGKSSVTYSTPDRMEYLFSLNSAVTNTKIDTLLFEYGLTNNLNVGLFYQALLGNVSGVTWSELTTFDSVCKNSAAFKKICNTNRAITLARNNNTAFNTMADNYSYTEAIIAGSSVAVNVMSKTTTEARYTSSTPSTVINKKCWLSQITGTQNSGFAVEWNWRYTTLDGLTHDGVSQGKSSNYGGQSITLTVNKFINKLEIISVSVKGSTSSAYAPIIGTNVK